MPLRLRLLTGAAVVLVLGFGVMLTVWPEARTRLGFTEASQRIEAKVKGAGTRSRHQRETETLELTVEIPACQPRPEGQPEQDSAEWGAPRTGPRLERCPKMQVQNILKIIFAIPGGCVVGSVTPDGPADKAGLKPGDSIVACNEFSVVCPKTLVEHIEPLTDVRVVKFIIERPKAAEASVEAGEAGA
jgi:hypothetical protein